MSEQLFRLGPGATGVHHPEYLIEFGIVVPVERCEHGKIDRHMIGSIEASPITNGGRTSLWCPGAGLEDDDE